MHALAEYGDEMVSLVMNSRQTKELDYVDYKLSHNAKYQILFYE